MFFERYRNGVTEYFAHGTADLRGVFIVEHIENFGIGQREGGAVFAIDAHPEVFGLIGQILPADAAFEIGLGIQRYFFIFREAQVFRKSAVEGNGHGGIGGGVFGKGAGNDGKSRGEGANYKANR